ncbi:MAG: GTPase ObgE [Clostridia bacterium]|nr:GTPase ObgE [Clostridia bacterium]
MFIDRAKIFIKSGKGGNGSVSFRREPFVPQGGPDGGDGGKGGDVVIMADENLRTLMDFRYKTKYEAQSGENGKKKNQFGKKGENLIIKVPVGTLIKDSSTNTVMKDLLKDGEFFIAAKGGRGGRGNVNFKNSIRQAPNFAEAGGFAKEKNIELILKLIADVGLVGYPNVGKSTLLSVATSASPKIGNYHFTTITPNLGVVLIHDSSFVIADIPGLIEGASSGLGLGLDFLKHIERTRVLIHVVDVSGSEGRNPIEDFEKINTELATYSSVLMKKPQIVAANKMDIADSSQYESFKTFVEDRGYKVFPICAPIGKGVDSLLTYAYEELQKIKIEEPEEVFEFYEAKIVEEEEDYREIYIKKEGNAFLLSGKQLEKIFNSTNFNDVGSLRYLYKYIENKGTIERLKEMGLTDGNIIRVKDFDFEYFDD